MLASLNADLEAWGAAVVALWLIGGSFYRWFIRPRVELQRVRLADEMRAAIKEDMTAAVKPVHAELRPNGGSSFRDQVNAQFEVLGAEITMLAQAVKGNTADIDKIKQQQQQKGR